MTWVHLPSSVYSPDTLGIPWASDSPESLSEPSATSSGTPTANGSSSPASRMGYWTTHRFGVTYRLSTDGLGADEWISSLPDSRASRTPSPDDELVSLTTAISGRTPSEWYLKLDPDTCSWRTPGLMFGMEEHRHTLTPSLLSLPASGMTRNGRLYQLQPLVPRTSVGDGGVLPTPSAHDGGGGGALQPTMWRPGLQVTLASYVKKFPTPKARDSRPGGFPSEMRRHTPDLNTHVMMYPTPQERDYRTGMPERFDDPHRSNDLNDRIGGQLNPRWVEWLMGIPIGWTRLEPLEMESSLLVWQSFCEWSEVDDG